jgi:PAS domain S-box-containing protein
LLSNKKISFQVENIGQLLNFFSDPVVIISMENELILNVNSYAEEMYGFSAEEMIGKSMNDFSVDKSGGLIEKIKVEGFIKDIKSMQFNRLNEKFEVLINAFLIEENTNHYIVSINKDISLNKEDLISKIIKHTTHDLLSSSAVIVDAQHKDLPIIYANTMFLLTTGYSIDEVLGKNCKFLQNDDTNQIELKILKTAIKNKTSCRVLLRNYTKQGQLFWNDLAITPYFDEKGILTHYIGVQNDITKQIEKQDFINKQNEILRQANTLANIGGWEIDLKTNTQISSPELVKIREDDEENSVVSKEYSMQFYPVEYRDYIDKTIDKLFNSEEKFDIEVPFITKKGNHKWVRSIGSSFVNNQGEKKVYGVLKDITKEKEQELKLKKIASDLMHYKNALDQIAIISITDFNGNLMHANETFCSLNETNLDFLKNKIHPFIDPKLNPENNKAFKENFESIKNGQIWNGEQQISTLNNKTIWINQYLIPIEFVDEIPTSLLFIDYDITKRKNQENFIKSSLEEKEVLISEIQHRVKNNLQIVASLMNIQEGQFKEDKIKEVFKDMNNRIMSMALIHDTIFQTNNYSFIKADYYFNSIIRNLYQALSTNNILINCNIEPNIELGVGTATNCGIVLNEALTNCIKYAFDETIINPAIQIHLIKSENIKGQFQFEIIDNGIGNIKSDVISSSRLGINLMKGLIEQMEGKFEIESNQGFKIKMTFMDNKKS